MVAFEYPATLIIVCRSRFYYDCVWKSHMRITVPARVYCQEIIQVHECAVMASSGIFKDPMTRTRHRLNTNLEVNNFDSMVVGSLMYKGGHSHYEGMDTSVNGRRVSSLLVTESLEVTMITVTVREDFDNGDIVIRENGVSIPAVF